MIEARKVIVRNLSLRLKLGIPTTSPFGARPALLPSPSLDNHCKQQLHDSSAKLAMSFHLMTYNEKAT